MLKKVVIMAIFSLLFLGMTQVKAAVSIGDTIYPEYNFVSMLIEANRDGEWSTMALDKRDCDEAFVYKLGDSDMNSTEMQIVRKEYKPIIVGIIKNGYGNVDESVYGITREDDLYMATKIAVNSAYRGHEVREDYRRIEELPQELKERADTVILAAEEMIRKGKAFAKNCCEDIVELKLLDEEKIGNDISRTYKVIVKGADFIGYRVWLESDNQVEYKIKDSVTGEEKMEFLSGESSFKVVIPDEKSASVVVKVEATINVDRLFMAYDNINDLLVYTEQEEVAELTNEFNIVHEEVPEKKPEEGAGEDDNTGNIGENNGSTEEGKDTEGENTEGSNIEENGSGNKTEDKNEGGIGNEEDKKDEEETKKPEGGATPEGTKPNDEDTKDEITKGENTGSTTDKQDTENNSNDNEKRRR